MPAQQWPPSWYVRRAPTAASESGTRQNTPGCCASLQTYERSTMASPSSEVPTPEATWVR